MDFKIGSWGLLFVIVWIRMQITEGTRKAHIVSMIDHMIAFGLWNMVIMFCQSKKLAA